MRGGINGELKSLYSRVLKAMIDIHEGRESTHEKLVTIAEEW